MHCCLAGLDMDVGLFLTPYLNDSRLKVGLRHTDLTPEWWRVAINRCFAEQDLK